MSRKPTLRGEPCDEAKQLGFLEKRVSGYKLADDEDPICDYYLIPGWYSMGTYVISSQNITCGATFSWYRTGELPTDTEQGIVDLELCLTSGEDACLDTLSIKTKKCEENHYIFELVDTWSCPEAYCIENVADNEVNAEPPNVTSINPLITPTVHYEARAHTLRFFCTFDPLVDTTVLYTVTWAISLQNTLIAELTQKGPVPFNDIFDTLTMLTENDMKEKGYGFGDTIVCIVRAMFELNGNVSEPKTSPVLFCGIEVLSDSPIIFEDTADHQNKTATINLRLNIPFGCRFNRDGCSLDVLLVQLEKNDNCRFSRITAGDGKDYDMRCGGRIQQDDVGKTVSVHVDMIKAHVETSQLVSSQCWSHNDPHMRTFDGRRFEHHDEGVWYLYINTEEKLQVLIKTKLCGHVWNGYRVTCNCGVVVNAGRDVFSISACETGNFFERKFTSCEDEKVLEISTSSSGRIDIILPTKTKVQVNPYWAPFLNVDIWPSNADAKKPSGLCGYMDQNWSNDYVFLNGTVTNDETAWRHSWRVPDDRNLFENNNHLTTWPGQKRFCSCKGDKGDITEELICSAVDPKSCHVQGDEDQFGRCFSTRVTRRKRGVNSVEPDTHGSAVTSMNETESQSTPLTGITFDNATAWAYCEDAFNITVLKICSQLKNFTQTDYLQNCVDDILAINDTVFTPTHVDLQ
ncbi:VWDE-like protein [Mya arenaria]|uniref:VWDE-like protein n=1 Tax=Mya arenaria TaxID=6604 RepID=A0ABY7GEG8_MYAAR|nr:VWDE-like protein [Mya arenaria]